MSAARNMGIVDAKLLQGMSDAAVAKSAGAGIGALIGAFAGQLQSQMFASVLALWLMWMVLGLARAMHRHEDFSVDKMLGGVWRLVAALALACMAIVGESMILASSGARVPLSSGVCGWLAVAFFVRSADAGTYFFPGFRDMLAKLAPQMFPTASHNPRRRKADTGEQVSAEQITASSLEAEGERRQSRRARPSSEETNGHVA